MPTLEEISEQAAADAERCVRESVAMDYAWQQGKLADFLERKYAAVMEQCYGGESSGVGGTGDGANPGANPGP
jgi:hypothetical protein